MGVEFLKWRFSANFEILKFFQYFRWRMYFFCLQEQQLHEKFSYDVILSLYGFGLSLINNTINKQVPKEIFYAGITPTEVTWMYYGKGKKHWVPFSVNNNTKIEQDYQKYLQKVKGGLQPMPEKLKLGSWDHVFDYSKKPMLLIAPDPRKVKRTYMHGIFIQYQQSPNVTHFQFKVSSIREFRDLRSALYFTGWQWLLKLQKHHIQCLASSFKQSQAQLLSKTFFRLLIVIFFSGRWIFELMAFSGSNSCTRESLY